MRKIAFFLTVLTIGAFASADADAGKRRRNIPQERQNRAADRYDLTRLKDRAQLKRFIAAGLLVRVPDATDAYYLETVGEFDPDHAELYAYVRPYAKRFLDRELGDLAGKFGGTYKVVGLTRTKAYQRLVCGGYDSAICGKRWWQQSSHLTGATVDVSFEGMSRKAKKQLRKRLRALQKQDKVIYIEETGCFHVMVLPTYEKKHKRPKARK